MSKKKDMSKIKCYKCREYGHYANNCPKKDVESGLFIGMATHKRTDESGNLRTIQEMKKRHAEL